MALIKLLIRALKIWAGEVAPDIASRFDTMNKRDMFFQLAELRNTYRGTESDFDVSVYMEKARAEGLSREEAMALLETLKILSAEEIVIAGRKAEELAKKPLIVPPEEKPPAPPPVFTEEPGFYPEMVKFLVQQLELKKIHPLQDQAEDIAKIVYDPFSDDITNRKRMELTANVIYSEWGRIPFSDLELFRMRRLVDEEMQMMKIRSSD